jgi:hypothetical protein
MPVAKTYQSMTQISAPYQKNKRMYILVRTKSGAEKEVRWYSDAEYARMYHEDEKANVNYRQALGFRDAGYITVYVGVDSDNEWIFRQSKECRFHRVWGWYTVSDETPIEVPGVKNKKLYWNDVKTNEDIVTEASAEKAYADLVSADSTSQHFGNVGEVYELILRVKGTSVVKGRYGEQVMNIMEDTHGNEFVWTTSHGLEKGKIYIMKGKVKAHALYHGIKQTIIYYCRDVEEFQLKN